MGLVSELRRRNVIRVAIAYVLIAWVILEAGDVLAPALHLPEWVVSALVFFLVLGFPLALIFAWAFELTPEGIKLEKHVDRSQSITHITGRKLDYLIIAILAVALAFFAYDKFVLDPARDAELVQATTEAVTEQASPAAAAPMTPKSIAVLPFVNMSDDPSNEYFSDGISEELLNLLARIPKLRVAARTSSFSFKGKDIAIPEMAKQLNVAHILEGSVRKAGDQVRITAQLIKADDGYHLWSKSYDRQLDDIFAIQDDIAESVVDALRLTLLGEAPRIEPINPESYVLYLRAVHVGWHMHAEALEQSNALLKKVLAIAPDYAKAWRLLARNYAVQVQQRLLPRDEGNALARDAISQALAIDPDLAEAHSWLAVWEVGNGGDLTESAHRLQHALKLNPNSRLVISHAASFLSMLGRLDETIAIREYELSVDPLSPIVHGNLVWHYLAADQPDEAIATAHTLQMLSPDYGGVSSAMCWALLLKGDYNGALQAIQKESNEAFRLYGLVTVHHAMGQAAEADSALKEYIGKYGQNRPYSVASILAYRGEIDRSFAWLDKASSHTSPPYWIVEKMWFTDLYDDPRWLPYLENIGRSPEQLSAINFRVTLPE
jgi:TolB-like protein/Tfp pilus assembly protein PilF